MEGQEDMEFSGPPPPLYTYRGAMLSPSLQHDQFIFSEQRHHHNQEFVDHGVQMGMVSSSSPVVVPEMEPVVLKVEPGVLQTETVVKKRPGRPRKYVAESDDQEVAFGLSKKNSESDPSSEPKRARGRPPGTGRKQRLANVGPWMNASAGLAYATHVISVEAGEDIVSKVFSFSKQRPRALCILSGTGTIASVTLRQPGTSAPDRFFQGPWEILSLGGSYLVNEEGGPKTRTGGISVALSRPDGTLFGGGAITLIAASLVQVVVCSFVYGNAKARSIRQDNRLKEHESNNMEATPTSEPSLTPAIGEEEAEVAEGEADQTPLDYSSPGWSGYSGGDRSIDYSGNHNHLTDIYLTRG